MRSILRSLADLPNKRLISGGGISLGLVQQPHTTRPGMLYGYVGRSQARLARQTSLKLGYQAAHRLDAQPEPQIPFGGHRHPHVPEICTQRVIADSHSGIRERSVGLRGGAPA